MIEERIMYLVYLLCLLVFIVWANWRFLGLGGRFRHRRGRDREDLRDSGARAACGWRLDEGRSGGGHARWVCPRCGASGLTRDAATPPPCRAPEARS